MGNGERVVGPRVRVLSDTAQEFEGVIYYLCGNYFADSSSDTERRLHRAVWLAYHLHIPEGFHVHHEDEDRSHNQIENLLCLPGGEHIRHHNLERREELAEIGRKYQPRTKEWHASEAGRQWHKQHYQNTAEKLHARHEAPCSCCGKVFLASESIKNSDVRYCSKSCKAHARRQSGVDDVARVCGKCGAGFMANKYSARKSCDTCFPARRTKRLLPDSA